MAASMEFALDPRAIGLPSREELVEMRIWDTHYHGISQHDDVMPYFDRMGVERLFCLDVGFMRPTKEETESAAVKDFAVLEKWKHRMSGLCRIEPAREAVVKQRVRPLRLHGPVVRGPQRGITDVLDGGCVWHVEHHLYSGLHCPAMRRIHSETSCTASACTTVLPSSGIITPGSVERMR